MDHEANHTVLLVCGCEIQSEVILRRLFDAGIGAIGPAPTANQAMSLAAQTAATVALVATPPAGRRNAAELARDLMATWGIPSLVLDGAQDGAQSRFSESWAADSQSVAAIQRALVGLDGANSGVRTPATA